MNVAANPSRLAGMRKRFMREKSSMSPVGHGDTDKWERDVVWSQDDAEIYRHPTRQKKGHGDHVRRWKERLGWATSAPSKRLFSYWIQSRNATADRVIHPPSPPCLGFFTFFPIPPLPSPLLISFSLPGHPSVRTFSAAHTRTRTTYRRTAVATYPLGSIVQHRSDRV